MASPTDLKDSVSSKSLSPPSYGESASNNNIITNEDDQAMDSIVVESLPLSPLPPPDGLSPLPLGPEDTSMRTPTDDDDDDVEDVVESMSDDGDDEDDEEEEEGSESLETAVLPTEYIVPIKEPEEENDSTKDMSENSVSVNGNSTAKIEFGESLTRGGKLRKLAPPPPLKRRKTPTGRSRTPRAPSPVIPPRGTSPWPEIQDSDIRNEDDDDNDRDAKRRRTTSTRQETNGTKESTPQPGSSQRGSRRQGKDTENSLLSAEERLKRSKRVKISPRKEKQQPNRQRSPPHPLTAALVREEAVSGTATPRFIINMKGSEKEDSDPTRYNEETCGACGGPGRFLCCEGCPKSFHFTCLDPPIDENDLPEDSWYLSVD
jgi:PHD-finger